MLLVLLFDREDIVSSICTKQNNLKIKIDVYQLKIVQNIQETITMALLIHLLWGRGKVG